jgi:hypothetical protein
MPNRSEYHLMVFSIADEDPIARKLEIVGAFG